MMNKKLLKKLQMGIVSLSAVGLLAACGTDDMEEPPMDDDPAVEEPVDGDVEDEELDEQDPVDEETEEDAG